MKSSGSFQPFRHLKQMLQRHATPIASLPAERVFLEEADYHSGDRDQRLFERAMSDVIPLGPDARRVEIAPPAAIHPRPADNDPTMNALRELIGTGRGFRVADTPEYIEGTGYQVPAGIARELHRGTFAIQAHIDLHGMTVPVAFEAFNTFLRDAVRRGFSTVLVVHGRGLSSAAEPVLKLKVVHWLTTGTWRKWVVAYASARPCDGGAGATYVLLRHRPLTKRHRRLLR